MAPDTASTALQHVLAHRAAVGPHHVLGAQHLLDRAVLQQPAPVVDVAVAAVRDRARRDCARRAVPLTVCEHPATVTTAVTAATATALTRQRIAASRYPAQSAQATRREPLVKYWP